MRGFQCADCGVELRAYVCPSCGGTGQIGSRTCGNCDGRGGVVFCPNWNVYSCTECGTELLVYACRLCRGTGLIGSRHCSNCNGGGVVFCPTCSAKAAQAATPTKTNRVMTTSPKPPVPNTNDVLAKAAWWNQHYGLGSPGNPISPNSPTNIFSPTNPNNPFRRG
jgi:hypothetical protein